MTPQPKPAPERVRIADLEPGHQLKFYTALVSKKLVKNTKQDKPFWILTLRDRSGEIACLVFDIPQDKPAIEVDDFVSLNGIVEMYEGRIQIKPSYIYAISVNDINIDDFLPRSKRDPQEMYVELVDRINGCVGDEKIRRLLTGFLESNRASVLRSPASMTYHQAYTGGLLEHILSMTNLAVAVCQHYPEVNRDHVIAGCVLHDIGKLHELSADRSIQYTSVGKLVGHILIGARMVWDTMSRLKIDQQTQERIMHLIASHHGEFGDIQIQTLEGLVLHYIDNLDAKVSATLQALGSSSDPKVNVPILKREVYR